MMDENTKPRYSHEDLMKICEAAFGCPVGIMVQHEKTEKPEKPFHLHLVRRMADEELDFALAKFGPAASYHEGYALIKEEFEETQAEIRKAQGNLDMAWAAIKEYSHGDSADDILDYLEDMECMMELAVAESIQTLAMIRKTLLMANRPADTATGNV